VDSKGISVILVITFSSCLMLMLAPTVFANTLYAQLPDSTTTPSSSTSALPDNAVTITSPTQDKSYSFSNYGRTSDNSRGDIIQGGKSISKASHPQFNP
jgi:hypothetical protein